MHEALISHIRRFLEEFVKAKQNSAQIMSAHQPILEAIRRRDEPEARRQVRQHLSFSMKDYEDFVRQGGPGF